MLSPWGGNGWGRCGGRGEGDGEIPKKWGWSWRRPDDEEPPRPCEGDFVENVFHVQVRNKAVPSDSSKYTNSRKNILLFWASCFTLFHPKSWYCSGFYAVSTEWMLIREPVHGQPWVNMREFMGWGLLGWRYAYSFLFSVTVASACRRGVADPRSRLCKGALGLPVIFRQYWELIIVSVDSRKEKTEHMRVTFQPYAIWVVGLFLQVSMAMPLVR